MYGDLGAGYAAVTAGDIVSLVTTMSGSVRKTTPK
jgi:hypothetical protein